MHKKSFMLGVGLTLVIVSVLAYLFYSIQYKSMATEFSSADESMTEEELLSYAAEMGLIFMERDDQPLGNPLTVDIALTDDEIIEKARELGMIFPKEVAEENFRNEDTLEQGNSTTDIPAPSESIQPDDGLARFEITVGMNAHDVALELERCGVITDIAGFEAYLGQKGLTKKLRAGLFEIKKTASYAEIAEMIKIFTAEFSDD